MSDVMDRLEGLSPERQAVLRELLRRKAARQQEEDVVRPRRDGGPAPLSFAQQRLWLIDRLAPGSSTYNVPFALRLSGALDVDALERALGEIVRRHESLRTVFAEAGGQPVQVVAPAGFVLPVEDLSGLDEEAREAAARRRAMDDAVRPFDLAAGPLFRAALLRLGGEEHQLLLCMHHIVGDGWSVGVLSRELGALYAAYRDGGESPLPELPVQYADYAVWQRERLQGETLERELAYWRERLAGAPALLELPTDHPRPAVRTAGGASLPVRLAASVSERLLELGRREDATPFMVLLGAFQVLLSRYSGSEDVVVGSPIAGRTRGEVEGLIGFFVNTLVLRTDLSGDPSFREVLRRVREGTLGAYEHQQVPFEKLVAELQPERSLSHAPLFQVAFSLQNAAQGGGGGLPGVRVRSAGAETGTAKFDLSLTFAEGPRGLSGWLEYSTDLFERGTIERMVEHLGRVLEQVSEDADVRLSALELLSADERGRVIEEWNRTERPYPRGVGINDLFEAQVRARPEAEALVWGDLRLTYGELDARANQLAHRLARLGVGPEHRVGLLLERGPELIVSILAILKAGGCYVPLDPEYPAERLRLMLADAGIRVLLSRGDLAAALSADGVRVVALDEAEEALAAESAEPPRSGAAPENLAYIVYTSGSTGKPKGVMVAHRHVVQLVVETDYVRFGPGDRIAQASNASFDALTFELFGAVLNGATLVGVPRDVLLSPPAMRDFLRQERITTLYQTTALLNQLTREQPDIFASLREVLFGGQASDADRVRALLRSGKPERLLHMYGPTETTAWCSWEEVRHVADDALTVSVGVPTGNQRIYLLDGALRPTPVGVPGEAYVGGDGVVRGYLDRPSLTAERFLPDPFSAQPGARMYRTGDRLRWKEVRECVSAEVRKEVRECVSAEVREWDGVDDSREATHALTHSRTHALEFVGRVDEQVKIRGFRIEPGEVESALSAHPGVREARVIVREDQPGEKRLAAYAVGEADAETLRSHLRASLPEYMLPAAVVVLERLPLTPNGKLDVKALPAPGLESGEDRYVAPRTPVEEVLAEVWAEVLRVERVGAHDSFFELGGHSLLAVRVVSRIREVFGVELPLRALFEGPTVAEVAVRVEALRRAELPQLPPVVPVERDGALPLSFAQERLWFLDRLEPDSAFYNIPTALRLPGALDAGALERALGEIVRRHEALRTVFAEVHGSAVQVVAPFAGFALPVEDLSGLGEEVREAEVRRRVAGEAARPFDLAAGPLFRAALLRLGEEDHVLLLSMHHIVSDGWSLRVLFRELSALYGTYRDGEESRLPPLPVQYADFAVWQRETLHGERLESQLAWWKERLAGAPALLELPTDRPRPPVQTHRGAFEPLHLPAALAGDLRALARREGATLYMVLLGAFQVLLSRYSGSEDIVVGTTIAGRTRAEVEPLIGLFMNTLVLRTGLSGDPDFGEVLRRVRDMALGAYEHQDVPFERLVSELRPERSTSHEALFQVLFELHESDAAVGALPGLGARGIGVETGTARVDLSLGFSSSGGGGLNGGASYSTDLFERGTVARMLAHLRRVLEQVAGDPDRRLSRLELMGPADRARVLEWNGTTAAYPAGRCIHQLFAAQAARTPDAVAVTFGGEPVTYRELDRRANRIANHLVRLGVGPEVRVALCLERGPEMMPALLGVMKAGGAYVPVDPSHPAERIGYVLDDSAVGVVLTQDRLRERLPASGGVRVIAIDAAWDAIGAESADPVESGVTSENLAYVIYTSGSTGRPKGVAMHHRGVVNYIAWGTGFYGADRGNGSPVFSSLAVDLTITNLLPLFAGKPVHLLPEENAVEALARALRDRPGFGAIKITPVHLSLLTPLLTPDEAKEAAHTLVIGADFLSAETTAWWQDHAPGVRLMNEYGPTETVVGCSAYVLPPGKHRAGPVPVGPPIQNLRFYVLDAHLEPVPAGLPGELYIGGAGVARGYLYRPALSAEKFVPDPFAGDGARMYRSGDRALWHDGGDLMVLGRTDDQVKVRGYRVEPGEVEAVLRRHPGVGACRVVVRDDLPGGRGLAAYVVGDAGTEALREHLRRALPEYMVPAAFVRLDALPRTTTGKIDPRTLPAPGPAASGEEFVAPRTPVQELLAALWCEVLKVERVGAEDSFFALGGHSLLALRLISRVRDTLGVSLPLRALFEGPTLAELAGRVEALRRAEPLRLPPVVPVDRAGPLPLSFAQERLWFLDRLDPGSAVYNVSLSLRLGGALDVPALERALGEVVRRHEVLRTVFRDTGGAPVQVVAPFRGFALPVEDLAALPPAERRERVERRAGEEAARPFDLAAGPLFRATLLRLGDEEHLLLAAMHHTVTDGWSTGVLRRELSALYEACRDGRESPLAELPVQYADYAVWQREQLRGEALDRELAWWRERLAGAPTLLELPTDHPRPPVQSFRGAREEVAFAPATLGTLRELARAQGVTLYMLLLAAWQVLLARYAGSTDVVVGSASAGRGRSEVEGLIGLFANTLALRTDLSGDPEFREVLGRVREATLGAWEHQDLPFELLVAELRPERSLGHSPLFQATFVLDDAAPAPEGTPGLRGEPVGAEVRTTKFDLTLGLTAGRHGLEGSIEYASDLFEPATIRRMRGHLARVLEQVVADPARRLSALELMTAEERRVVVEEWGGRDGGYPPAPAHRMVARTAARVPDAPALSCGGRVVSYRELDAASSRLARHLAARGAGPESLVALVAERSPETVVAILAVLKAGAAYLPLDPEYPEERLRYMLADSGARLLVTPGGALPEALRGQGIPPVVDLRAEADAIAAHPDRAPEVAVDVAGLAYVIYTSGSTGRPKGVAVAHNGISTQAWWQHSRCGLRAGDRVLQFASFSFDAAVNEVFPALTAGATLVLAPREALVPGDALRDTVRGEAVTFATFPPSVLAVMDPAALPSLRVVLSAGEALSREVAGAWARAVELHNAYGPTEATVGAASARVAPDGRPSIGRPLENARAYVLDAAGRPLPAGVPGELCLGGAGVARGYLGRPALTAERFVPDPFGAAGARLYRTGDRARWRDGGELEYLGRLDGQVKVRGFRIEPGEIEAVLRRHPGVSDCAVVAREERLVAYVVGAAGAEQVREHLRRHLPPYMVPGVVVALDALPLTPNGKVDRRALPAPAGVQPGSRRRAAETELEARVAAVWAEVLGLDEVGVEDNFFDLGGHSLLLVRLQARLAAAGAGEVRVVELFQYPTVRALAGRLAGGAGAGGGAVDEAEERGGTRQAALDRRLQARRRRGGEGA